MLWIADCKSENWNGPCFKHLCKSYKITSNTSLWFLNKIYSIPSLNNTRQANFNQNELFYIRYSFLASSTHKATPDVIFKQPVRVLLAIPAIPAIPARIIIIRWKMSKSKYNFAVKRNAQIRPGCTEKTWKHHNETPYSGLADKITIYECEEVSWS